MVISKTPYRVSFFGGGTDYPSWYEQYGGVVLSTALDKYCYVTLRALPPFFGYNYRLVYSKTEEVNDVDEIEHPAIRSVLKYANIDFGLEIHHDGDLPARSGTGSSSTFVVGLIKALNSLLGIEYTNSMLAREAIHIEQDIIGERVGSQDQVAAAFGGFNKIMFSRDGQINVAPIILSPEFTREFERSFVLIFTGISRIASEIAVAYDDITDAKKELLLKTADLVLPAVDFLSREDIVSFGRLLDVGWQLKRGFSPNISNPLIDSMYSEAIECGAVGGKVIGAGGGGFILICAPGCVRQIVERFQSRFVCVPFGIDNQGSTIIYRDVVHDAIYAKGNSWKNYNL